MISVAALALPVQKHKVYAPSVVNGRPVPTHQIKLENDPRYKGPKLAVSGTPTKAGRSPNLTPYQRRIAPAIKALRAKSATQSHLSSAVAPLVATPSLSSQGLAVNFPGFQAVPTVAGGLSGDTNLIYSSLSMDVNRDGKPDIVDIQADGAINVLLNPGTGNFSDFKVTSTNSTAVNTGVLYVFAQVADINRDGYPDLVVQDTFNNAAFVYLNQKDGTFGDPQEVDFAPSNGAFYAQNGGSIVVLDTNGDKIPDLVSVTPSQDQDSAGNDVVSLTIQVALGKGDGTFQTPTEQSTNIQGAVDYSQSYGDVVAADMNGDGKVDLVFALPLYDNSFNVTLAVIVARNNGDGTFSGLPTSIPTTGAVNAFAGLSAGDTAVADINGDGIPDVIFSPGVPGIYLALGNGDGTVQNPKMVLKQPGTDRSGDGFPINFADVNGDGILDIVSYNLGFVSVYLGQGKGVFNPAPSVQVVSGSTASQQPVPADYLGHGVKDIVAVDAYSRQLGLFAGGKNTFAGPAAMAPAGQPAQNFQVQAVGDFNGDGYPDVVAQSYFYSTDGGFEYDILLGLNDGKGNFTYKSVFTSDDLTAAGAHDLLPAVGDFNGDGKLDILFAQDQNAITPTGPFIAYNKGDGTFETPVPLSLGVATSCFIDSVDVGDLNGDGRPDIVATYAGDSSCQSANSAVTPSGFFVFLNAGSRKFKVTSYPYGYELFQPKLVDLNGDGALDLVVSDSNNDLSYYYLYDIPGVGDGTFNVGGSRSILENTVVSGIIAGDFDGDGKQDLLAGVVTRVDPNGDQIDGTTGDYLLKGNGDLTFRLPAQYNAGSFAVGGQVGDFNGDGRPDIALAELLLADVPTGNFVTLMNVGAGSFAQSPLAFTANTVNGNVFLGDFNNDGGLDVLLSAATLDPALTINEGILTEYFLNRGGVRAVLAAGATSVPQSTPVALTVTLTSTVPTAAPGGTMTFYSNGAVLGIVPVTSSTVTYSTSTLPVGTDVIYASYSGDANFNIVQATNKVSVNVTALAPSFLLSAANPATLTLRQGQTATAALTLTTNATFTGSVALTCSGAPLEASCNVLPGTMTLGGGQTYPVSVVIATTPPNNQIGALKRWPGSFQTFGGVSLAALLLVLPVSRRRRLRKWSTLALMVVASTASLALLGCGTDYKYPGTPVGSYKITVTATSGSITQSTSMTITITK